MSYMNIKSYCRKIAWGDYLIPVCDLRLTLERLRDAGFFNHVIKYSNPVDMKVKTETCTLH